MMSSEEQFSAEELKQIAETADVSVMTVISVI
jgi:hypothetical protein